MDKRGTGVTLIAIAAFLFGVKYLSAATFGASLQAKGDSQFEALLSAVGSPLSNFAIVSGLAGLAYIIWAEVEAQAHRRK